MRRKTLLCDWDETLVDENQEWLPGARGFLQGLQRDFTVTIWSCRANWPEGRASIREALDAVGFRSVKIFEGVKPEADVYLDDRAVRFAGIEETKAALREL